MIPTSVSLLAKSPYESGLMPDQKPSWSGTICEGIDVTGISETVGESCALQSYKLNQIAGQKCLKGKSIETEK
jgi:hypothetical protein